MTTERLKKRLAETREYLQRIWDACERFKKDGRWEILFVYEQEFKRIEDRELALATEIKTGIKPNKRDGRLPAKIPPRAIENAMKEECPKGHAYSGENVYVSPDGRSGRVCRECTRIRQRKVAG